MVLLELKQCDGFDIVGNGHIRAFGNNIWKQKQDFSCITFKNMNLLILSDIHGNLAALESVLKTVENYKIDACVLLGDLIDYGMHSNEVLRELEDMPYPILCNIWGNHEFAIQNEEYSRFSSQRGRLCAQYTQSILDPPARRYLCREMVASGWKEFSVSGKLCLAIHGNLKDPFWGRIVPGHNLESYGEYDFVFSGHTHIPHFFEDFFPKVDPMHRNKKRCIFVNPGSVGQPRNLCPLAQFALIDTESGECLHLRVPYDIEREQDAYTGAVDDFYRDRLSIGI